MEVLRYAAFTDRPDGGNPAGVVLDAGAADESAMLRTAADVGFSETAFLFPSAPADRSPAVRYFSPRAEVPFCGHATIATAVADAERHGAGILTFRTIAGDVTVRTRQDGTGRWTATLTSVAPRTAPMGSELVDRLLGALRWDRSDLDPALPVRAAFAGAWHPVVAAATRERLARLDYDFAALETLMAEADWTTVDLVWRESPLVFHARNPFPPGGVVEDPATGAAAAALGGYLRDLGAATVPADLTVHQGHDLGRPSLLTVHVPSAPGTGIDVTGTAVPLDG